MKKNMIQIELEAPLRKFIVRTLKYLISDEALDTLKKARANKQGFVICSISEFDLDQMIGELSYEANHNNDQYISEMANIAAEILEIYQHKF